MRARLTVAAGAGAVLPRSLFAQGWRSRSQLGHLRLSHRAPPPRLPRGSDSRLEAPHCQEEAAGRTASAHGEPRTPFYVQE